MPAFIFTSLNSNQNQVQLQKTDLGNFLQDENAFIKHLQVRHSYLESESYKSWWQSFCSNDFDGEFQVILLPPRKIRFRKGPVDSETRKVLYREARFVISKRTKSDHKKCLNNSVLLPWHLLCNLLATAGHHITGEGEKSRCQAGLQNCIKMTSRWQSCLTWASKPYFTSLRQTAWSSLLQSHPGMFSR